MFVVNVFNPHPFSTSHTGNAYGGGGGGIAIDVACNNGGCLYAGNKLFIENCSFDNNNASRGSSVLLSHGDTCIPPLLDTTLLLQYIARVWCGL